MNQSVDRFLKSTAFALLSSPALVVAATPTDPIFEFGLLGTYSKLKFEGKRSSDSSHMPEGGLFLNYGNKMTGEAGLVYQAELGAKYAQRNSEKVKDAQADIDLGWRAALDARNYVDVIVGTGYTWNRFEPDVDHYEVDLTSRSPFAKAALGYNHQFDNTTVRLEAGVRRTLHGDAQLKIKGVDSETIDLKDSNNPFVELSFLFNRQGELPIAASIYYSHIKYDMDGEFELSELSKQTRTVYGAKLGVAF